MQQRTDEALVDVLVPQVPEQVGFVVMVVPLERLLVGRSSMFLFLLASRCSWWCFLWCPQERSYSAVEQIMDVPGSWLMVQSVNAVNVPVPMRRTRPRGVETKRLVEEVSQEPTNSLFGRGCFVENFAVGPKLRRSLATQLGWRTDEFLPLVEAPLKSPSGPLISQSS